MMDFELWEYSEPGIKRKLYKPGEKLMIMKVVFEEGAEGASHSHPHEQLTYCLKGDMEFTIKGKVKRIQEGEVLTIPPHAVHGAKALAPSIILDVFTPLREDLLSDTSSV
ncbi:cupin domain-containing protein [Halalkalibacterium halodurans]|uniref:Cupin n=2 Tax=Halalkalibacterium halodurans TaxID=86665 RepID=A0A0M0KDZ2_ALKHA|nr:cupin domain-containing protein [Halalkalibacterium halodurans]